MKNLDILRGKIATYSKHHVGRYLCIGNGDPDFTLRDKFDIAPDYLYWNDGGFFNKVYGSSAGDLYYITKTFYKQHVELMKTDFITAADAIKKAESLLGKIVMGQEKQFTVESWSIFGKHAIPSWMSNEGEDLIDKQGWVCIVDNDGEFAVLKDDTETYNLVKLNDEYDAIIVGDMVHVGCQKIHKDRIIELANLLR